MRLKDLLKESEGLSSGEKFGLKEVGEQIVQTHKRLNELLFKYMNGLKKYHSKHRRNVGLAKKLEVLYKHLKGSYYYTTKQAAGKYIYNFQKSVKDLTEGVEEKKLIEGKRNEFASIYNMKEEMKEGKFDPKNPSINVHGLGVYNLKLLEKVIKRDLTKAANDLGYESGIKNLMYHLYKKHSPLGSKIKGLAEVYEQMNSPQYKRAVTLYKRKR